MFSASGFFNNLVTEGNKSKDSNIEIAINTLRENKINSEENLEAIYSFPKYANVIAQGLVRLNEYKALNTQNRLRICAHAEFSDSVAVAITMLVRSEIYTLSHWLLIIKYPKLANIIASSFEVLQIAKICTEKNTIDICATLCSLEENTAILFANCLPICMKKLTQESLEKLLANPKDCVRISKEIREEKAPIPPGGPSFA